MSRKLLCSFHLDTDIVQSLKAASKGEEIPKSQIVRECLTAWLTRRGYMKRPTAKGGPRTRT